MLTTVGTTVRIPAGFFTPMIMIGAIIGTVLRCCGAILTPKWVASITHPSLNRSQGPAWEFCMCFPVTVS
jgi:H+/Cl- antiporter ClcA